MLAGFQNVHYIAANEKEERAMKLPSAEQAFLVETTPAWADSLNSMDSSGHFRAAAEGSFDHIRETSIGTATPRQTL